MSFVTSGKFPASVKREDVARDWAKRGFSCELFVDPPGREWNDFVHNTDELVTVLEGRLWMQIGEQEGEAGPGDEVFIRRNTPHSVRNAHNGTTRWLFGYA